MLATFAIYESVRNKYSSRRLQFGFSRKVIHSTSSDRSKSVLQLENTYLDRSSHTRHDFGEMIEDLNVRFILQTGV